MLKYIFDTSSKYLDIKLINNNNYTPIRIAIHK